MRSRASFKGHPIHPALIPFPLAFLAGGLAFDVAGSVTENASLWTTGGYLTAAGIGMALVAAVPGLIDYVFTVPPRSSGKRRATRHMAAMLTAVALFALSLWVRGGAGAEPPLASLALSLAGGGLLSIGGWMGGVLVSRNQVSVDHRYADAGKWSEARIDGTPGQWSAVARADELAVDQMKLIRFPDRRVVLARTDNGWVAFDDRCTHRGGSLAGGVMMCGTVQCPWHGSQFDAATGAVRRGPAQEAISAYQTREQDGSVLLRL